MDSSEDGGDRRGGESTSSFHTQGTKNNRGEYVLGNTQQTQGQTKRAKQKVELYYFLQYERMDGCTRDVHFAPIDSKLRKIKRL